jgi:hypothetical protein
MKTELCFLFSIFTLNSTGHTFGFLSSASISFAMMEEETMNQAPQYELRPGK